MNTFDSSSYGKSMNPALMLQQAQERSQQNEQKSTVSSMMNVKGKSRAELEKTAQDFESMFLSQMLQPMFDTVQVDPLFGGGQGEQMWKSLMVDEYAKEITKHGGVGIADQVLQEMLKLQEQESKG